MPISTYLKTLSELAEHELVPQAQTIDKDAHYPKAFLQAYGAKKGFAAHGDVDFSGLGLGIATQVKATAELGRVCGASAFNAWCQTACAWYIQNSANTELKQRYLSDVLNARILAGTGLSNTVKSLSGIERHNLRAQQNGDEFVINGALPWVTNIGEDHIFAATAELENGEHVMFLIEGNQSGVSLSDAIKFCALNGTQTLSVRCDDVRIPAHQVLATPEQFDAYLATIKSGFVTLQLGMALGALHAAAGIMRQSNQFIAELNSLLDYGIEQVEQSIEHIEGRLETLCQDILNPAHFLEVLKLRLYASEAVLAASQAASLHAGAHGYLETHHAQRLAREAMFVAIITPSVKHLKKEIARLEGLS